MTSIGSRSRWFAQGDLSDLRSGGTPRPRGLIVVSVAEDLRSASAQREAENQMITTRQHVAYLQNAQKRDGGPHHGDGGAPPDLRGLSLRFQDGQSRTAHL